MSLSELKQAVESLSSEELQDLAAHIWWCERRNDPAWRAEISERVGRSAGEPAHSQQELEEIHRRLKGEGR